MGSGTLQVKLHRNMKLSRAIKRFLIKSRRFKPGFEVKYDKGCKALKQTNVFKCSSTKTVGKNCKKSSNLMAIL